MEDSTETIIEPLGRPLKEGEVVHHLDLNKSNNSPDNLLVLSNPYGTNSLSNLLATANTQRTKVHGPWILN